MMYLNNELSTDESVYKQYQEFDLQITLKHSKL